MENSKQDPNSNQETDVFVKLDQLTTISNPKVIIILIFNFDNLNCQIIKNKMYRHQV